MLSAVARCSLLIALLAVSALDAQTPRSAPARTTRGLTSAEFAALPASHVLEVRSERLTKAQVEARMRQLRSGQKPASRAPSETAQQRQFADAERSRLAAENQMLVSKSRAFRSSSPSLQQAAASVVACTQPQIDATLVAPPIEPGEDFFLKGSCFGDQTYYYSDVLLLGNFKGGELVATIVDWQPDFIHARVPGVWGVVDHPIQIQVKTKNAASNQVPTTFKAERTAKYLEPEDAQVLFCSSPTPGGDVCNGLSAEHLYTDLDFGVDVAKVTLKNGWAMESYWVYENHAYYHSPPSQHFLAVSGFQNGSSQATIEVSWVYVGLGGVEYDVHLLIVGPVGVPHL